MLSRRGFALGLLSLGVAGTSRLWAADPQTVSATVTKTHVDFKLGGQILTRYVVDPKVAKPYFWPLNVAGTAVTRSWPMEKGEGEATDHVHQKSAWFCHGDIIPVDFKFKKHLKDVEGVDFWSERKGHGKMVCIKVEEPVVSGKTTSVKTSNEWRTAEDEPILAETRTIGLRPVGKDSYLIILDIDLHAKFCGIIFGDTKEGSMGVRVRESLRVDKGKGKLVNADSKSGGGKGYNTDKKGCWGLISDWCDYSGPVDDKGTIAGVALFADPKNPSKSAWHARDYGLLAANPFGRSGPHTKFPGRVGETDLVKLKKGEHLKLRFALYMHPGDSVAAKVAAVFKEFVGS